MWQFMPATGTYFDLSKNAFATTGGRCSIHPRRADHLQKLYGCSATGSWRWRPTTGV